MKTTFWDYNDVPSPQLAHGYRWETENWNEEPLLPHGSYGAMGGLFTSIESFSRYAALHQSAWPPRNDVELGPLKRSSIREMQHPWSFKELISDYKFSNGLGRPMVSSYGYGLRWLRDSLGRVYVGHSGGLPGFGSNWLIMPEHGLGVILFANATYAPAEKVNLDVLNMITLKAQLKPRQLPSSNVLKNAQKALLAFLPNWEHAPNNGLFAANFFLDYSKDSLEKEAKMFFEKIGNILSVRNVMAENQLRGHFIIEGEKTNLQIHFALTPESPPLIQQYRIKEMPID